MELEHLKYPIGRFIPAENYTLAEVERFIGTLRKFPAELRDDYGFINKREFSTPH